MQTPWRSYALLAASMGLVGAYVGLSKLLVAVFPVFLLAGLRFAIAAVAMINWAKRPADEEPLSRSHKVLLFWESFFGNFLFSICMLYGVKLTSALAAGVVMSAIPAVCAVLGWVFLKERVSARVWLAIALAAAGISVMAFARQGGAEQSSGSLLGYALLFAAVCCEAIYVVIGKKLAAKVSPKRISALINLWGLALVLPLAVYEALSFNFSNVSLSIWLLLLFYAIAASMWTVWLWMTGLKQVSAARAGVMTVMLPIAAAVVGVVFLQEQAGLLHGVALALALGGVCAATWPESEKQHLQKT
jgi:drug/metabolite transporter (DMT)-like permease